MAEQHFSTEFSLYLTPDYWSGHMILDGDDAPHKHGPADKQSNRYARQVLEDRLPMMQTFTPIERFEAGMLFDAGEHPEGTIALYKQHSLITVSQRDSKMLLSADMYNPHEPHTDLNFGYNEGRPKILYEHGLLYVAKSLWAVVTRTRDGEPALVSFSQGNVYRTSASEVYIGMRDVIPKKPQIRIGEAEHYSLRKDHEGLEKISKLYICGYGKAKRARKTGRQLVNSLIPRPAYSTHALGLSNNSSNS